MHTFCFMVYCHDGRYEVTFYADDEPDAWIQLSRMFVLRGVRKIELESSVPL